MEYEEENPFTESLLNDIENQKTKSGDSEQLNNKSMNTNTEMKSKLNAEDFKIAVTHFENMLQANGIKPKSKKAKEHAYAFLQGIVASQLMYKDPLHPALYIALLRNDINELNQITK